jgi:hypothetical protein
VCSVSDAAGATAKAARAVVQGPAKGLHSVLHVPDVVGCSPCWTNCSGSVQSYMSLLLSLFHPLQWQPTGADDGTGPLPERIGVYHSLYPLEEIEGITGRATQVDELGAAWY